MFLLRSLKGNNTYYLLDEQQYLLGRKDCDILIQNDKSISKKHAQLTVENGQLKLVDSNSKYKTYHNNSEIRPDQYVLVKEGDQVKFGCFDSEFKVEKFVIVTTSSQLSPIDKRGLSKSMVKLGGKVVDCWSADCTHLTISKVMLTVKVLHALIDNVPLVVPDYWKQLINRMEKHMPPPDINDFNKPPLGETMLNVSLEYNERRKGLFKGKLFIFPTNKSQKQMDEVIKKLGGDSISWENTKITVAQAKRTSKKIIIVQLPEESQPVSSLNELINYFKGENKRMIPLQEIVTAILLCSCEKDCNPSFNRADKVFTTRPKNNNQEIILVPDTQNSCIVDSEAIEDVVIPETEPMSEHFKDSCEVFTSSSKNNQDVILVPDTQTSCFVESEAIEDVVETEQMSENFKDISNIFQSTQLENVTKDLEADKTVDNLMNKPKEKRTQINSTGFLCNDTFFSQSSRTGKRQAPTDSLLDITKKPRKETFKSASFTSLMVKPIVASTNLFTLKNKQDNQPAKETVNKKIPSAFCIKRKPSEDLEPGTKKINPFFKKRRILTDDEDEDEENPPNRKNMFSTSIYDLTARTIDYSSISISSIEKPLTWLSKESMPKNIKEREYLDEEVNAVISLFKKNAKVELKPMDMSMLKPKLDETDSNPPLVNGQKNFKKFVKVAPLRPQKTVINTDNFIKAYPSSTAGLSIKFYEFNQ